MYMDMKQARVSALKVPFSDPGQVDFRFTQKTDLPTTGPRQKCHESHAAFLVLNKDIKRESFRSSASIVFILQSAWTTIDVLDDKIRNVIPRCSNVS